jgi:type I restriction enzyme R subunit
MSYNIGGEEESVQNPIINYVREERAEYITTDGNKFFLNLGWEYISPDDAIRLRGGETGLVFRELFINQMQKLNPEFMDHLLAEDLLKKLENIPPTIEGNLIAWEYLKGLRSIFIPQEKRERDVLLIDAEEIDRNTFHVTDEFSFTNGSKTIRADIVFLINGIPLIFIETKAAYKIEAIAEALEQVRRYHRDCPELLSILQVYSITNLIKYYYSATWNTSEKLLFNWKEETQQKFELMIKTFFDKQRVVKLLTDCILFTRRDDELQKVLLRPHQIRAVDTLIQRAQEKKKRRGLIWHTQGSGKTYTMIVTAQKIIENPLFEDPTVLMLVDRNELETQLFGNLTALGIGRLEVVKSKRHLKRLLKEDQRGLIVSMIHKFEDIPQNINTRENFFVLVDEAHRTTGGKLGNYLMGALPNATYIGFTGTPIDKTSYGKGTFIVFGRDDPPLGYLDKYSIRESIEDGTTVPLHYTLAPNELLVDKETLEKEFLNLADAQGMSDIDELNKILERAVTLRTMLKDKDRVEQVAQYAAKHFREAIEPLGYKVFLVGVDREACALYKNELDKYLPKEYSTVIYSASYNDPPELSKYHLSDEEEKRVRIAFRNADKLPKILIVTEKLLTGFDAPILYCMYLDKPMRDHVLLQAIARVNRPYEDERGRNKPSGFVLDFVGIFANLEKALAFDSKDIEGVVHDIEVLKEEFIELIEEARKKYLTIISGKKTDKAVEAVLEHFKDEEKRHTYYQFFKEISTIYDIISPDDFLRPYLEDINTMARMFKILKEAYETSPSVDRDFSRKTVELVQKYTDTSQIKDTLDIFEINEETLRKIEESNASETEKVFNLLRSIQKYIDDNIKNSPYLISIGEKAAYLAKLFKERQNSTLATLEELKKLLEEINAARKEQEERNMTVEIFSIFWLLRRQKVEQAADKANEMKGVFEKYPYWKRSEKQTREVKKELYRILLQSGIKKTEKITETAQTIMRVLKES